jgi:predicted dehydrogenase
MSTKKIRVAQVGIANHGTTIVNAIRASNSLELVSVYDIKPDESERVSKETGARRTNSYDEIINDPAIDAVVLVTPNQLHVEQVLKAAKAKKHVFVEKPISRTVPEAKRMIASMREAGLVLMVGHNTRRRLVFRRAKKILEDRQLGKVVAVEMNVSRSVGLTNDVPAWKADPAITALLPMTQLGIHFIDTLYYLLGPVARVSCIASNIAMSTGAADATASVLQLESGVPTTLSSYYVTPDVYYFRIYGTQGILHCHPTNLKLELYDHDVPKPVVNEDFPTEGSASFTEEMEEFGECVLTGKKPETGGEEGLRALAVIEAMVHSLNTRKVIELKDILENKS